MKVLFHNRPNWQQFPGGDTVVMLQLQKELVKMGIQVDITENPDHDLAEYDLVHSFNLILPEVVEPMARNTFLWNVPHVIHAFQENWSEFRSQSTIYGKLLMEYVKRGQVQGDLNRLFGLARDIPEEQADTSIFAAKHSSAVFCCSSQESQTVSRICYQPPTRLNHYGSVQELDQTGPETFRSQFGLDEFVLCVGRIEQRKNQLMLLAALEHEDIPIVFADGGFSYQPDYLQAVRNFRRKGKVLFTGRMPYSMLASAYRAARVHCLPSWYELPGLVNLEAASYGCNVVCCPSGGIGEYLQDKAWYFKANNPDSIQKAVLEAWSHPREEKARSLAERYTWRECASEVLATYQEVTSRERDFHPLLHVSSISPHLPITE